MAAKNRASRFGTPLRPSPLKENAAIAGRRELLLGAGLVLLTFLAYLPSFHAGFLWDDDTMLTANRAILSPHGLKQIWASTLLPDYFPLTSTSLWLEWRLWGFHAAGYHTTNVLFHAASVLVLWRILRSLEIPGAWLGSLLFAVHPVNVESVAWIAERKNILAMFFFLLTVLFWLRAEKSPVNPAGTPAMARRFYFASIAFYVLALLSKTAVVPVPFVLLLCSRWVRRDRGPQTLSSFSPVLKRTVPFFVLSLAFGLLTIWFQYHRAIAGEQIHSSPPLERFLGASQAFWFYVLKALVPTQLSFVYRQWTIDSTHFIFWLPFLVMLGAALALYRVRHSRKGQAMLFCFGYFLLMLGPILGFLKIYFQKYSPVADHWQYFALIGICALAGGGGAMLVRWIRSKTNNIFLGTVLPGFCLAALVGTMGFLTFHRAVMFADAERLWLDTLAKNPSSWLAHNNLGLMFAARGEAKEAIAHYSLALEANPSSAEVHNNLGAAYVQEGRIQEAEAQIRQAFAENPKISMTEYDLGIIAEVKGFPHEAEEHYRAALRLDPESPTAHNNLGCLLAANGNASGAVEEFRSAIQFLPNFPEALNNLGNSLINQGRPTEALTWLNQAISANPRYAAAHFNAGRAFTILSLPNKALPELQKAVELQPSYALAHLEIGNLFMKMGRDMAAAEQYEQALQANPNLSAAHYQLAVISSRGQRWQKAIDHYQEAIRISPDWIEPLNNLAWIHATHSDVRFRDGVAALKMASHAADLTQHKNPATLDTLAAAQAEMKQFALAAETARSALELASGAGAEQLAAQIRTHLAFYEKKESVRE